MILQEIEMSIGEFDNSSVLVWYQILLWHVNYDYVYDKHGTSKLAM